MNKSLLFSNSILKTDSIANLTLSLLLNETDISLIDDGSSEIGQTY